VTDDDQQRPRTMIAVRYVLPAVVVLAGVVLLAFNPTLAGLEGWALLTGAGLAISHASSSGQRPCSSK